MKNTVFEYQDYKRYIDDWIHAQENEGHGARSALARAMGCQVAYVSQVIRGHAHFSLDQCEALAGFLGLSEPEHEYLFQLVVLGRAGTKALRDRTEKKLADLRAKRMALKDRLGVKQELSADDQARYYSAWYYAAVHILLTIPEFQSRDAIRRRLKLSQKITTEVLEFLLRTGLAKEDGGRLLIGASRMHLGEDASMITQHHTNWRLKAVTALEKAERENLHYSSVVSIAKKDALKIREILTKSIETVKPLVKESKEEELYSFCLDFFQIP